MAEEVIAGRYRVERRLAQGGMGEVFAVVDQSTGQRLALKRLIATEDVRLHGMFEREYHALCGLSHPRIIDVADYGVDYGGEQPRPYYTMELLDGQDLRQLAPLPYRQACRYLRDVASSLALLHARKLLHRDVSPRNVRVTSDDRCKLIDFGAMSNFGVMDVVVGTPPYVAPEAVQHTPLDQRADLYALGALMYWLLTGKHAFPARSIHELPEMWRRSPPAPSAMLAAQHDESTAQRFDPIPPALDDLVMALLSPNPLARPASAVEVSDRLTAIGELEPDREELSARSYLHGGATVGRERERARLRKRLNNALGGLGASVLLEAVPGMGSSRLISELALSAQLSGAAALIVDAKLHRGVYGVAHALIDKALITLPEDAVEAAREEAHVLARFSPALATRLSIANELGPLPPGELRRRTQAALASWVFALAARKPIVIAIDNAQRLDEGSAALVATLARACRGHALLLVVARKPGEVASSPQAMRAIEDAGSTMKLRGLSRDDVHTLLRSLFGDAQNTGRLAEWVHKLSGGNPQACMDLVHHLVDQQVIRYADGAWTLPQELLPHELPSTLENMLDTRLARLTDSARKLAEALCVHRGPLPIERCVSAAAAEKVANAYAALEALAHEDVLVQVGATYHFSHETVRERIYGRLDEARRKHLHRLMGTFLSKGRLDLNAKLDAGWHLINGGAETEGAELLAEAGQELAYHNDELAAAVPALHAALVVYRKERRPAHQLIKVIGPLAIAGYRVDRRLATEYGEEAVRMLRDLLRMSLAERLRPYLGRRFGLYFALATALFVSFLPGRGGVSGFRRLVTMFITCCTSLAGTATICADAERARRFTEAFEPLSVLGPQHAAGIAYDLAKVLARLPEDRLAEVANGCEALLPRFERPVAMLTHDTRVLLIGGIHYALGAMSCFRDGTRALKCAEDLDALGLKLYSMAADQIRAIHHALRGEIGTANAYRERVELHAIQASTGWQVEVWQPSGMNLVYLLTGDVIGMKSTAEQLDRLAKEVPTLTRGASIARASYYQLKGNPQLAYELRRTVLDSNPARGYIGWPASVGAQIHALLTLGRAEEAKALGLMLLSHVEPADEPYIAMYQLAFTGLALAEAELGDYDSANARLAAWIAKYRADAGPLTLGNLHAARARVAIKQGDTATAREHLDEMDAWLRPTGNPALIAQCERMKRELVRSMQEAGELSPLDASARAASVTEEVETVRSVLSHCAGPAERANRALDLLVRHVRGLGGFLFTYFAAEERLQMIAPHHGDIAPVELQERLLAMIRKSIEGDDEPTTVVSASEIGETSVFTHVEIDTSSYRLFLLRTKHGGEPRVVGAVAVLEGELRTSEPREALLEAVARSLFESGDDQRTADPMLVTAMKVSLPRR